MLPTLLIIGDDSVGRSEFVSRLHASSASTSTTDAPALTTGAPSVLTLDNKYYTASVAVCGVNSESAPQHDATAEAEGVILLFSRHDSGSFAAARDALQSASTNAEVQLCVANHATAPSGDDAASTAAQRWAAEQLFEYVEVHTADADADAALELDGEPQGMKRVLEALQAHMWPGLRMKPQQNGDRIDSRDSSPDAGPGHTASHASNADAGQAASTRAPITGGASADCHPPAANGGTVPLADAQADVFGGFLGAEDADPNDEADRTFAQLLGQLAGARERLRDLPDAERRAGAENMALQMMQLLGIDDSDTETAGSEDATSAAAGD